MKIERKNLGNGEISVVYLPREDRYHVVEGILRGNIYTIHILCEEDPSEMPQCFEIKRRGREVSIGEEGETLLESSPITLEAALVDEEKLTKTRINRIALDIIRGAREFQDAKISNMWLDICYPYRGYALLREGKMPAVIVNTEEWFKQNPNWRRELYEGTPRVSL